MGYTLLAEVDIAGSYDFEIAELIKRDSDGKLFFAYDSGCSCPEPFEKHSEGDMEPVGKDWREVLLKWCSDNYRSTASVRDFMRDIEKIVEGTR